MVQKEDNAPSSEKKKKRQKMTRSAGNDHHYYVQEKKKDRKTQKGKSKDCLLHVASGYRCRATCQTEQKKRCVLIVRPKGSLWNKKEKTRKEEA